MAHAYFKDIEGKMFTSIEVSHDKTEIIFTVNDNEKYRMYHIQDCCENVYLKDICGDLNDLIDTKILFTYLLSKDMTKHLDFESATWAFYLVASIKGYIIIRWCGDSNGRYLEKASFELIDN